MRYSNLALMAVAALPLSAFGSAASGQTLAERVSSAPAGRVQFTYASRAGVCGNGRTYFSANGNMWYGSFNDADRREECASGPMRVVLDRAGREVVSVSAYAGPVPPLADGITDLGRVSAREAADYLLGMAERSMGRVSRDAILPAMLADSVDLTSRLLGIARNQDAARETRRSAISWLGRAMDENERNVAGVAAALVSIAKDEDDNRTVRQQALRTLARLEHGAGTAALMELTRDGSQGWLAREAVTSLNASGDPRAREHLRQVVRAAEVPDDVLAAAIRGLGGSYATGADIKLLRDTYPKLSGDKSREAAVSAVANFGGEENVRWLLALASDPGEDAATRRRAIQHAWRGGTAIADIIKVYDESTDNSLKTAIMSTLAESGEKAGTDKLMQIAQDDDSASRRRRAVSLLGRSNDERVRRFLTELASK